MSLSDQLMELSSQARQLQASAEAIRNNDDVRIRGRKAELSASIEGTRVRLANLLVDAPDQAESDWADEGISISESFEALKRQRLRHRARLHLHRASGSSQASKDDALDDIDFAIYAIQEAEYAILDAVTIPTDGNDDRDVAQ